MWFPMVTHIGGKSKHDRYEMVAVSHSLRAAYVYNPKAAHTSVLAWLKAASRTPLVTISLELQPVVNLTRLRQRIPVGYRMFTFVREPISDFYSGYAETVWRVTWGGARAMTSHSATFDKVDCNRMGAKSIRFAAILLDIKRCSRLNYDAYHLWPQVVKLDVLPEDGSYDFIGSVDTLQEDMNALLRRLGAKETRVPTANPAKHNVDRCGHQISVPPAAQREALPIVCELLAVDYACLGFRLPAGCERHGEGVLLARTRGGGGGGGRRLEQGGGEWRRRLASEGSGGEDGGWAEWGSSVPPTSTRPEQPPTCALTPLQNATIQRVAAASEQAAPIAEASTILMTPHTSPTDSHAVAKGGGTGSSPASGCPDSGCTDTTKCSKGLTAGRIRLSTQRHCAEVTRMNEGVAAFTDRPAYLLMNVSAHHQGSVFWRFPHRLLGPETLVVDLEPAIKDRVTLMVFWK